MRAIALFFVIVLLAACSREVAPTPANAQPTTVEEVEVSPTLAATRAPAATATATIAAATATSAPTATATATATATPVSLLRPEDFGENRNPLTGELVDDPDVLQRRPIAVKISNYPPKYVRPQSGLGQADLVFEHLTEGAITRFTAVFYDTMPEDVGPIRSGRLIDLEIPAMYDAAFAYSGSSIGVSYKLSEVDFRARILRTNVPGYYRTGEDKPFEHTLYGDPAAWWEVLEERGENRAAQLAAPGMVFAEAPPEGGEAAEHININYQDSVIVDWEYDEDSGRYWRWADGEEHVDQNTGEQISAANVVVVFATHKTDYTICETQVGDACLAYSVEIQIMGQGDALVFRDGRQYEATWRREERHDMLTFYDAAGDPLPLQIGNTWFQMVPYYYTDPVTVE